MHQKGTPEDGIMALTASNKMNPAKLTELGH